MDRAIFALAIESDETTAAVGATKEHVANIRVFFHSTVKEAKRYLNAEAPTAEDEDDNGKGDEEESSDGDD